MRINAYKRNPRALRSPPLCMPCVSIRDCYENRERYYSSRRQKKQTSSKAVSGADENVRAPRRWRLFRVRRQSMSTGTITPYPPSERLYTTFTSPPCAMFLNA